MSETNQSGAGRREVAYRMFAAEFTDADYSYSESDEERAPNYVITPTGARANRLFVVGVLTEVEEVSDGVLRGRVVDPTGAFVLYAGQYQPDEQAFLEGVDSPTFVAVTGKARTFSPEDSDQVFTSIRPESISEVDAETRDRWTVQTAEQTVERVGWMATALTLGFSGEQLRDALVERGADDGLAHGIGLALSHYGTTPAYLDAVREMALDAARVVAGEKSEIDAHRLSPDADGEITAEQLTAKVNVETQDLASEPVSTPADSGAEAAVESTSESASKDEDDQPAGAEETTAVETEQSEPADTEPVNREVTATAGDTTGESTAGSPESTQPKATSEIETSEVETSETETSEVETSEVGTDTLEDESDEQATVGSEDVETDPVESPTETGDEDDLGDFEAGDFEPEEFELEEETREEIEEEYGTDFQTGTEVGSPGEAGVETPEEVDGQPPASGPEDTTTEPAQPEAETETDEQAAPTEPATEAESGEAVATDEQTAEAEPEADEPETGAEQDADEAPETGEPDADEPEDLQAAVVDLMGDLDTGDGADREDLIAEMNARYGTDRETVEDAIQDALMDGQCYEPNESSLKPI